MRQELRNELSWTRTSTCEQRERIFCRKVSLPYRLLRTGVRRQSALRCAGNRRLVLRQFGEDAEFLLAARCLCLCLCLCLLIGNRSLGITPLLLPAKATQIRRLYPFSHARRRTPGVCPKQFRNPPVRSLTSLEVLLQTRSGLVIDSGGPLLVHGAPCSYGNDRNGGGGDGPKP